MTMKYDITLVSRINGEMCEDESVFITHVVDDMGSIEEAIYEGYDLVKQYEESSPDGDWVLWGVSSHQEGWNE